MTTYDIRIARKLNTLRNSKHFWKLAKKLNGNAALSRIEASIEDIKVHAANMSNITEENKFTISFAQPLIIDEELDSSFTLDELEYVLKKSKDNKAAGINRIPVEYYKNSTPLSKQKLLDAFNIVYSSGLVDTKYLTSHF